MYLGIDLGKEGFICYIDKSGEIFFKPIPLVGKIVDLHELELSIFAFLEQGIKHCVIEDLHAVYGSSAKGTFNFGFVCGATEALLASHRIPYTKVKPKLWQKELWIGVPIQKKPSSTGRTLVNDTKLMSLLAVKRLFPEIDLRATNRCKKPHDGKVDALLLAEYCRRKY